MSGVGRTVRTESPEALRTSSGTTDSYVEDPGWLPVGKSDQEVGSNTTVELLSWVSTSQEVPQASLYQQVAPGIQAPLTAAKTQSGKLRNLTQLLVRFCTYLPAFPVPLSIANLLAVFSSQVPRYRAEQVIKAHRLPP